MDDFAMAAAGRAFGPTRAVPGYNFSAKKYLAVWKTDAYAV